MHQGKDAQLPPSIQSFVAEMTRLKARWEEGEGGKVAQFAQLEIALRECLTNFGRRWLTEVLEEMAPNEAFEEDGKKWTPAVSSHLSLMSSMGPLRVKRTLFRDRRNGPTRCPLSEELQPIAGFWTEQAARAGAMAVAEMPMARAEQFLAELGTMKVSRASLLRLTHKLGDLWESERKEHEQKIREVQSIPEEATTVAVSLDGVMLKMTDSDKAEKKKKARQQGIQDVGPAGSKEASVGVVSFYDAQGKRLKTCRYGRMPESRKKATKDWLRDTLEYVRAKRPDLTTVAVADGAADNWTFLEELKTDHEVVDFYHAAHHLHRHISKANGACTLDTQNKLKKMRHELLEKKDSAPKVWAEYQKIRKEAGTEAPSSEKKTGKRCPTFPERHMHRMNYAQMKAANLPIGSGVTESTCKSIICDRLRRTGMRWSQQGGQAVITLRAHVLNETFDHAWQLLANAHRRQLAA